MKIMKLFKKEKPTKIGTKNLSAVKQNGIWNY